MEDKGGVEDLANVANELYRYCNTRIDASNTLAEAQSRCEPILKEFEQLAVKIRRIDFEKNVYKNDVYNRLHGIARQETSGGKERE